MLHAAIVHERHLKIYAIQTSRLFSVREKVRLEVRRHKGGDVGLHSKDLGGGI